MLFDMAWKREPTASQGMERHTEAGTEQRKQQEWPTTVAIASGAHEHQTRQSRPFHTITNHLEHCVRTKENALLHTGGMQLPHQERENGHDQRIVQRVHEEGNERKHDDPLMLA